MRGIELFSVPTSVLAASLQAACMTGPAVQECEVQGAQYLGSDTTSEEVCALFQQSLSSALGDGADSANLSISLDIRMNGTIDAYVADEKGASVTPYPSVSIDVMDRALNRGDVEQLAQAVAQAMKIQTNQS